VNGNFLAHKPKGNLTMPSNPLFLLPYVVGLCASSSHAHQNYQQSNLCLFYFCIPCGYFSSSAVCFRMS